MKKLFLSSLLLFLVSKSPAEIKLPQDDFFPGWKKAESQRSFFKKELFNHIDGGAELFLEFGFEQLLVQRYQKGNSELTLEVYQMERPESALGIYLLKCGVETPVEGIEARNSGEKSQFTILKGRHFIHVNNFKGDAALLPVMVTLAREMLQTLPEENPIHLLDYLPRENLVRGSERLIRGPYALQPIFTFGEGDILQLGGKVFGLVANYKDDKNRVFTRILIPYPDKASASSAYQNLRANLDLYLKVLKQWETGFSFLDYRKKFGCIELKEQTLEILVNLSVEPGQEMRAGSCPNCSYQMGKINLFDKKNFPEYHLIPPSIVWLEKREFFDIMD